MREVGEKEYEQHSGRAGAFTHLATTLIQDARERQFSFAMAGYLESCHSSLNFFACHSPLNFFAQRLCTTINRVFCKVFFRYSGSLRILAPSRLLEGCVFWKVRE